MGDQLEPMELQTSLPSPVMLAVMLVRFRLYAGTTAHPARPTGR
jgi:hypothetical protein